MGSTNNRSVRKEHASAKQEAMSTCTSNFLTADFLTPNELAEALGVSERTLARMHAMRNGPPRCRRGNIIVYFNKSVTEWLLASETKTLRNQ